jgi:hypothetical protein
MANATPIRFLRSLVAGKRPDPTLMLTGQPAVNVSDVDPGLYFSTNVGNLVKIGPCAVGTVAPNTGAVPPGALGNTVGELWLDTGSNPAFPFPRLRVYDGTQWVNSTPFSYAAPIVSDTAPATTYPPGTQWWNSSTGVMNILYNDGTGVQWVQVTSSVSPA